MKTFINHSKTKNGMPCYDIDHCNRQCVRARFKRSTPRDNVSKHRQPAIQHCRKAAIHRQVYIADRMDDMPKQTLPHAKTIADNVTCFLISSLLRLMSSWLLCTSLLGCEHHWKSHFQWQTGKPGEFQLGTCTPQTELAMRGSNRVAKGFERWEEINTWWHLLSSCLHETGGRELKHQYLK